MAERLKYKRILLKISGEALGGDAGRGLDFGVIDEVCGVVARCAKEGVQIGIVVGGGNFWPPRSTVWRWRIFSSKRVWRYVP